MQIRRNKQRGDTIVEVLIAITVLAFALGVGYATANRSTAAIQSNKERYQAQLLANKQIEYLRAGINDYGLGRHLYSIAGTDECVARSGASLVRATNTGCDDSIYRINTENIGTCSAVSTFCSFKVTITWDSLRGAKETVAIWYAT